MDFVKIKEIAQLASEQNKCRVYDIYKHRDCLQVFIDKKNQAVNSEDCTNVFHSLKFLLNSELPYVLENKRLEVSTPGIEKFLREKWHFEEAVGCPIKLVTLSHVEIKNSKTGKTFYSCSFSGDIVSVSKEDIQLKNNEKECSTPFSNIKSARLIFKTK